MNLQQIKQRLKSLANKETAGKSKRFFKTGEGEYSSDDIFIGITVPVLRSYAKQLEHLPFETVQALLQSSLHEERQLALFVLLLQYKKLKKTSEKKVYFEFYVSNMQHINNWDLIDASASHIVGDYLLGKDKKILTRWAKSADLWQRRIAIVASWHFIKHDHFETTTHLALILLNDDEDLIHKATGWMLREVGKRDIKTLEKFIRQHYTNMPRTALRYAIEKFPEAKRKRYLNGDFN